MPGRHNAKNPDAPMAAGPEQWMPEPVSADEAAPSGDGPTPYDELASIRLR